MQRAAVSIVALALLAGCTTRAVEVPKPVPAEAPINSLALEQCVRENGPEKCSVTGN